MKNWRVLLSDAASGGSHEAKLAFFRHSFVKKEKKKEKEKKKKKGSVDKNASNSFAQQQ